jgi:hypothetical protein
MVQPGWGEVGVGGFLSKTLANFIGFLACLRFKSGETKNDDINMGLSTMRQGAA